jgi:hypothetical protein
MAHSTIAILQVLNYMTIRHDACVAEADAARHDAFGIDEVLDGVIWINQSPVSQWELRSCAHSSRR